MLGSNPSYLTVEISGPDGGLYPGSVKDLKTDNAGTSSVHIKFENDWLAEGWFPCDGNVFEAPPRRTVEEIRERLLIPGPIEVLYQVKQGAPQAWYPGQLVAEAKGLYTIDLLLNPPRRVHQPIEQLRIPRPPVVLTGNSIHRVEFHVPPNARSEATDERHLAVFAQHGKFDYVRYDPERQVIIIMVYGTAGVHRAEILSHMHFNHAAYRQSFRDEIASMRVELYGPQNTGPDDYYRTEFTVMPYHLHRALGGPDHANLAKARALPGIHRIWCDQKTGRFHITASDEEAAKPAQELLEIISDVVYIEHMYVGHLIGKLGAIVNEIIHKSGVISLIIHDTMEMLKGSGYSCEWRDGFAAVILVGMRPETELARMLVEFQVDHNRQMDAERRRTGLDRPERQERRYRGELSRQHTDEREHPEGGEGTTRQPPGFRANDDRRGSDQTQRSRDGGSDRGHQGYRGGSSRREGSGPFGGRRDAPRREGPAVEDKRKQSTDAGPASKDWPELGNPAESRASPAAEAPNLALKDSEAGGVPKPVVQNGELNGHGGDVRNHTQPSGGYRGGGGGNNRGRYRGGRGGGGNYRAEEHRQGDGGREPVGTDQTHAASNGQQNGRSGGEVDGDGFKPVRGKKQTRGQRGEGNGMVNGIRPATEEPAANRREDQVSR